MKKILSLLLLLAVAAGSATAQNAEAIVERYYKLSGMDKVDLKNATAVVDMDMALQGMSITASTVMRFPDKMKIDMTMMGQNITMLINGNRGVVVVPGMGRQELPKDKLKELKKQNDMLSSMKWNLEEFNLTLKPSVQEGGKSYDVVEMAPKVAAGAPFKSQTMYFDHQTGLLANSDVTVAGPQGDMTVAMTCNDYVRSGEILYPSKIDAVVSGVTTSIHIRKMVVNCPVDDKLFEIE